MVVQVVPIVMKQEVTKTMLLVVEEEIKMDSMTTNHPLIISVAEQIIVVVQVPHKEQMAQVLVVEDAHIMQGSTLLEEMVVME